jgi:hypothetical protein
MGRPIHKKYFGNTNTDGVGGEGVATVVISEGGEGYYAANAAVTFSAPQIAGGTRATGTVTIGNVAIGNVSGVVLTNLTRGTGYTSAPSVTFTGANTTLAEGSTTLTSSVTNALNANARITGGTVGKSADILSQRSSRRYRVRNADGTGVCALVPRLPTAVGEMALIATDSASGTYYVTKLTAHLATLTSIDGTEFEDGDNVRWTLGSAVLNTSVSIANN